MADPKDRELFEAHMRTLNVTRFERYVTNPPEYKMPSTEDAWQLWQAARATPAEAQEPVAEWCGYEHGFQALRPLNTIPFGTKLYAHPAPDAAAIRAAALEEAARVCDEIKDAKNEFGARTKNEFGPAIASGAMLCAEALRELATKGTT